MTNDGLHGVCAISGRVSLVFVHHQLYAERYSQQLTLKLLICTLCLDVKFTNLNKTST
ncbi:MAG: hypothetical protein RM368_31330 [Nostoc sp. DedSLP03]|nr:hypothetical protein [Nostoc sp. DedSLP03]